MREKGSRAAVVVSDVYPFLPVWGVVCVFSCPKRVQTVAPIRPRSARAAAPLSMSSSVPSRSPLTALMRGSASISSSVHHVQSCPVDAEFDSAAQAVEWLRDHGHARRRIGRHQRCVQQPETHRLRVQLAVRRPINKKQPRSSHHGWRVGRGMCLFAAQIIPLGA